MTDGLLIALLGALFLVCIANLLVTLGLSKIVTVLSHRRRHKKGPVDVG